VTAILSDYEQIIYADFEFVAKPGEAPDVVCLAWREEPSGQTHRLWRDQLDSVPPYRTDARVLYVCFVGNAELGCHLALGWPLPVNVLDLSAEFRCISNGLTTPAGKGLLGALVHYQFNDTDCKLKDAMRKRIMQGWPFTAEEREQILRYCASDVEALHLLLGRMRPEIELPAALHRGEFVAVSAQMEQHGVPLDTELFPQLTDPGAWRYIRDAIVPVIDADYGVYIKGNDGDWHFSLEYFGKYLERQGITWPDNRSR
jgi:DNA polymerase-1